MIDVRKYKLWVEDFEEDLKIAGKCVIGEALNSANTLEETCEMIKKKKLTCYEDVRKHQIHLDKQHERFMKEIYKLNKLDFTMIAKAGLREIYHVDYDELENKETMDLTIYDFDLQLRSLIRSLTETMTKEYIDVSEYLSASSFQYREN